MTTHVFQFPCLKDNYGALIHDSGSAAPRPSTRPTARRSSRRPKGQGWRLTDLLDHPSSRRPHPGDPGRSRRLSGTARRRPGQGGRAHRRARLEVGEGDIVEIGALKARVIETPGHTAGQVAYVFDED